MAEEKLFTDEELNTAAAAVATTPNLPPAGYKRDEVLARRQDALDQKIDSISDDIGAVNPKAFEEDREIQDMIRKDYLFVDIGPEYVVKWVNFVSQHGNAVWAAKAQGWQVVTAEKVRGVDRDLVKEDNTLRVGDVICVFMRKDRHLMMEQAQARHRFAVENGFESELNDLAAKNPKAFKVRSDLSGGNPHLSQTQSRAARKTALGHLGNQMKKGLVAGIPIK